MAFFHFYSIFDRTFYQQTVEDLIRRRKMFDLGLHCMHMSHKKDATLILYGLTISEQWMFYVLNSYPFLFTSTKCLTKDRGAAGSSPPASLHCVPEQEHTPSLVLVQPRKTHPFITERLLIGRKELN